MSTPLLPTANDFLAKLRSDFPKPAGSAVDLVSIIWRMQQSHFNVGGLALQYQYCRREILDGLITGQYATAIRYTEADVTEDLTGVHKNLMDLRDAANTEILRLEGIARSSRGGVVKQMATVTPTVPDYADAPDANSRVYRGDAMRRWPQR